MALEKIGIQYVDDPDDVSPDGEPGSPSRIAAIKKDAGAGFSQAMLSRKSTQ